MDLIRSSVGNENGHGNGMMKIIEHHIFYPLFTSILRKNCKYHIQFHWTKIIRMKIFSIDPLKIFNCNIKKGEISIYYILYIENSPWNNYRFYSSPDWGAEYWHTIVWAIMFMRVTIYIYTSFEYMRAPTLSSTLGLFELLFFLRRRW